MKLPAVKGRAIHAANIKGIEWRNDMDMPLCSASRRRQITMYNRSFFFHLLISYILATFRAEGLLSRTGNHIQNVHEASSPCKKLLFKRFPLSLLIEWVVRGRGSTSDVECLGWLRELS